MKSRAVPLFDAAEKQYLYATNFREWYYAFYYDFQMFSPFNVRIRTKNSFFFYSSRSRFGLTDFLKSFWIFNQVSTININILIWIIYIFMRFHKCFLHAPCYNKFVYSVQKLMGDDHRWTIIYNLYNRNIFMNWYVYLHICKCCGVMLRNIVLKIRNTIFTII